MKPVIFTLKIETTDKDMYDAISQQIKETYLPTDVKITSLTKW